jgi:magnesium transporter
MSSASESEASATREALGALLASGDRDALAIFSATLHPADIAEVLDLLTDADQQVQFFDALGFEQASQVVREISDTTWEALEPRLSDARLTEIAEQLDTDDAADLFGRLAPERRRVLLRKASPELRRDVAELLAYPQDSAGGIMKTEVASALHDATVREITEYLRRNSEELHDVHNVFVTDVRGRLLGYIPLRRLLLASEDARASEVMDSEAVSARADVDQEEVARLFDKYDLLSLPIVDSLGRLVGRITVDDVVDVLKEEATEDMLRLAGVSGEEINVTRTSHAVRSRLPWLALNLLTASAAAATIAMFESTIQSVAIAAALMTVVASQGGNAGNQTMTLMVRGLALGQIETRQVLRILSRESLIELANGLVLGLLAGAAVYLWKGDLRLSLVLGSALVLNLQVAALVGSVVPLALRLAGADPAVSSSVFVTAATDILGFFIFLGLLSLVAL